MDGVQQVTEVAKDISDYGVMVVICAIFVLLASGLMVACFKWFRSAMSDIISYTDELRELNEKFDRNNGVQADKEDKGGEPHC